MAVKRSGVPEDISPLVLEYHARQLGMSVDELLKKLAELPGKTTAEKLQALYDARRKQREVQMIYLPVFYVGQAKETSIPGNYRVRALILPPDSDQPAWATIFADSGTVGKLTSAPAGTVIEIPGNRFEYDEQYGSYTIRGVRSILPPNKDLLDLVAKEPTKELLDSLSNEKVVLRINPGEFDVDSAYRETSQGTKVIRLIGKLDDENMLVINIYDVHNVPGEDPWVEIKSFPLMYVVGSLAGVRQGIYRFNVNKVYVPEQSEETLEDRIVNYMKKKGKKELSPRALSRALRESEGDIIAAAKASDKLDYDEDADVVVLKE